MMKRTLYEKITFEQYFDHGSEALLYVYIDDGEYAFGYGRHLLTERCKQADELAWGEE